MRTFPFLATFLPAFLIATLFTGDALADDRAMVRVPDGDRAYRQRLGEHFGHLPRDRKRGEFVLEVGNDDWRWLQANGFSAQFDAVLSAQLRNALAKTIPGYDCYNTVEETNAFIDAQVLAHPTLASTIDIGDSWLKTQGSGGYDLRLLKITNSTVVEDKPKMFVMTGLHAREYTPVQLNLKFAEWLLSNYGVDAEATWLVDHNEFHLLLQANPDGRKIAEISATRYQRKNRNNSYLPVCSGTSIGVDLNRNFPWLWDWLPGDTGSSSITCQETYRGPSASSEPETTAIDQYMMLLYPDTRAGIESSLSEPADALTRGVFFDIHSSGGLVLHPWGVTTAASGNGAAFRTIARRLAWFNNYTPMAAAALYVTDGASDDNAYGKLGVPAFTFELGNSFFESCSNFDSIVLPTNLLALRYAARVLHAPYLAPSGPSAINATAIPAEIERGGVIVVSADASDAPFQPTGPSEPVHAIAGASVTVAVLPWSSAAVQTPATAEDGVFDEVDESVLALVETRGLVAGKHLIFVQASDSSGAVGPPAATFVTITTLFDNGFE